ncbi:serine/threonine protein kinase [Thermogemmatispora sp.]|uniref:serine/threonine protein kinase n=1 Tax=Thermogemmatispora sp. TaxID=1968838 RepID=UPI001D439F3E|nr:serine/threonine-protein kinase [Thermogemmatispora sp.]MBX5448664.1 serine/threonine protein kinase [Thermogemmatispora sp.]
MQRTQARLRTGSIIKDPAQTRYRVEACLGTGGFGSVYLVTELRGSGRLFALKEVITTTERERRSLALEANLLMRLQHPALPRVYRFFEDVRTQRSYLVMDYIRGANLEELRRLTPGWRIPLVHLLTTLEPVVDALDYLHSQQPPVIHRDVKPSNIIVPAAGRGAVLVDFGLAKLYIPDGMTTTLRQGTPGFAAPEQYGGHGRSDVRTDVYGLGATLYTLLTGHLPCDAFERVLLLQNGAERDPLRPAHELVPELPEAVSEDLQRAMAINSQERFAGVREFWRSLVSHAQAEPAERTAGRQEATPALEVMAASTELFSERKALTSRQPRRQRRLVLISLVLALLLALVAGALTLGLSSPLRSLLSRSSSVTSVSPAHATASVPGQVPLAGAAYPYPALFADYVGTVQDLLTNTRTPLALTRVQQHQERFSGFFSGLGQSGPCTGTLDLRGSIHFTVPIYGGKAALVFEGVIKVGSQMAGSFEVHDENGHFTGESGLWTLSPGFPHNE